MGWNGLPCPPPGVRFPTSGSNPVLLNLGRWILLPLRQLGSHCNYHCDHFNNPLQLTRASPSISFASPTWISYMVNRSTWALLNIILQKKKKNHHPTEEKTKQNKKQLWSQVISYGLPLTLLSLLYCLKGIVVLYCFYILSLHIFLLLCPTVQ